MHTGSLLDSWRLRLLRLRVRGSRPVVRAMAEYWSPTVQYNDAHRCLLQIMMNRRYISEEEVILVIAKCWSRSLTPNVPPPTARLPSTLRICFFVASCLLDFTDSRPLHSLPPWTLDDELTSDSLSSFGLGLLDLLLGLLPPQGHLRCHQLANWLEWAGMG
jgi:hypothetical protein